MYQPHFDDSHDAPKGKVCLWVQGPKGGVHYGGYFDPDGLDRLALDAIRKAHDMRAEADKEEAFGRR